MNIFVLDLNFQQCAHYHVDSHVVKLPLEHMQMLSTAHRVLDGIESIKLTDKGRKQKVWSLQEDSRESILYKATHINHPCSIWVRQSSANYLWLVQLTKALFSEYTYRYGKIHGCEKLLPYIEKLPNNIVSGKMTKFALAIPDQCIVDDGDPVESYRKYYREEKSHLFKWKNRKQPEWID